MKDLSRGSGGCGSGQAGFTLLETLIALVILSIGLMGYMSVHYQSINGRLFSKRMNEAVVAANHRTEVLLSEDYEEIENHAASPTAYYKEGGNEAEPSDYEAGAAHQSTLTVTRWSGVTGNPNAELGNLKTLSMTTQWKEKEKVRSTNLHTWVRNGRSGDTEVEE